MSNYDPGLGGSEVMYPPLAGNQDASRAMVAAQPVAFPPMTGFGPGMPQGPEIIHGSFNQTWLLNGLRRRWMAAMLFGLLSAVLAAIFLLWIFPLSSSVTALLEVQAQEEQTWDGETQKMQIKELEFFQETQKALLKSAFVLKRALTPKSIAQLEAVRKEGSNALQWLTEELRTTFMGEILEVRYDGEENAEEMVKIVDSVVKAYQKEISDTKSLQNKVVVEKLEQLHREQSKELEDKLDEYNKLIETLGGGDSPIATQIVAMLGNDIRWIDRAIIDANKEKVEIEVAKQLIMQTANSPAAVDDAIAAELAEDPTMMGYQTEVYSIEERIRALQSIGKGSSAKIKSLQRQAQQLAQAIQQYEYQKGSELRKELSSRPSEAVRLAMVEYMTRRDQINGVLAGLQEDRQEKYEQLQIRGEKSAMLAMKFSEIEQLRSIASTMDYQLRSASVQDQTSRDNIRIIQHAYAEEQINIIERCAIAGLGAVGAFCGTCYLVAMVEFRRRRLNGASDVDEGLGIRVLGTLPPIASRSAMQPGSPIALQLSESIDNVRTTIMHDSTSRGRQVVLVTSPGTMEGTTTVASHLALSLSRAGRRTLLVDGDLREPALYKLFGMPAEDGLCEVLRSEIDISDAVRPTNTEGLWLLPAGVCDMDAIHSLATDQLQLVFEKLRADFDFVVIDAPPVLGLADTLSIGQHVDGVILTVLRDHSEVRKIYQATELLRSLGIRVLGSVVNGVPLKADRRITRLHRNLNAKPKKLSEAVES
ncbi:MAG: polysaccharide biosynthesis tyrosine autokinase [Pirellulales bacterium]|nr:polysaccharide biosynthesis tyrosine autokinase [Pirellulales bacterium]